jgi:hypothetical protein
MTACWIVSWLTVCWIMSWLTACWLADHISPYGNGEGDLGEVLAGVEALIWMCCYGIINLGTGQQVGRKIEHHSMQHGRQCLIATVHV